MEPTREQHDAIHISDLNLIVVAGAGSGKTRVLVERYLQLLEDNPEWRINALVAITFTREAAFEMRHRLRQELERRAQETDEGNWARHLSQLDSARIDTIHGLCADLLRANAAHAGIDPKFEILDENESAILLDDVVYDALATIEAPISALFAHYDSFQINAALRDFHLINADFARLPSDPEALFEQWQGEWSEAVFEARDRLLKSAEQAALASAGPAPEEDKLAFLAAQYRRRLERIDEATDAYAIAELLQDCYEKGAVGNKGSVKAWGDSSAKAEAAQSLRDLRARIKETLAETGEPPGDLDRATAALLPLWHQLLQQVQAAYRERKRERAQLDFDDLERLAALLLQQEDVRRRYRGSEFKHLLVDEFQDTNAAQWQIIKSLADLERGGTLFAVGDPKQSIYQFRGADVSVFGAVHDQIARQTSGLALPLSTSFRSHRPLVEQLNALFATVLTRDESSPVKDFEVVFDQNMNAFRDKPPDPDLPAITIQLLESEARDEAGEFILERSGRRRARSADDMRRWEAYEIAAYIKRTIAEERPVFDKDKRHTRAMEYRDCAILFQSLTKLSLYEDVFKSQAIPFLTVAGRGYFDRQEVWDMLDLLRFLHNPADSLALATVLRSPLFAFSDDLLLALRLQLADPDHSREPPPLWLALRDAAENPMPGIAESDMPLMDHARETLGELLRIAGRVSISQLLRRALAATNYLAILTGLPDGSRRRGNVEKLAQLAEDSGKITLGKFSQYLADLSAREAREGEAVLEPGNAIRLMTAHASKGLEFPLVVLADASWERGAGGAPTVLAVPEPASAENGAPKSMLSCSVYSADSNKYERGFAHQRNLKLESLKEAAERKRLLYVAATRAQDYLLISGAVKQNRASQWSTRGWLKLLLPALELSEIQPTPEQNCCFAGCQLRVLMPAAPPPPRLLQHAAGADETLWDFDADPNDFPPLAPPLMQPLPSSSVPGPRHISATQIARLGASDHAANAEARRHFRNRFQDLAATSISDDDYAEIFSPRRQRERALGRILHEVLRYAGFADPAETSDSLIQSIAWEQGLTNAAALRSLIPEIRLLLRAYSDSLAYRWIMNARAAQRQVYTELPFIFRAESRVIHGVIDVLLQGADGSWVIIDYKSSKVADGDFKEHAKRYRLQLGIYAAAARKQLGLPRPPLAFVHYIRGNQMIELEREDCQRELDRIETTIGEVAAPDAKA